MWKSKFQIIAEKIIVETELISLSELLGCIPLKHMVKT
jgi:multimeric flavodoxin WrbA